MTMTLFASTTPGLEAALLLEVQSLGWKGNATEGGVEISGPDALYRLANLRLRTANRVLLRVASVVADNARGTLEALGKVDLQPYLGLSPKVGLKFNGEPGAPPLPEVVRALQRALTRGNAVPSVGAFEEEREDDALGLFVRTRREGKGGLRTTVSVDTSGGLLYRRGYRQEISRAPLRETLAAGLLLLAGYEGSSAFWDPMCGSGTLLIEAAMMAARKAPGLDRAFAFERFPSFDEKAWALDKERARSEERRPSVPLRGTDLHAGSLGTARRNARRAGVLEHVTLERVDVTRLEVPRSFAPGHVVTNPPYGKRVGEVGELGALYSALGDTLRGAFAGWRVGVLVPEGKLEATLQLRDVRRFAVPNGGIRCGFLVAG